MLGDEGRTARRMKGLIQVYTGPGKGKTTAAIGLIVRALGHERRVLLVRLLKPAEPASGELVILRQLPGVRIIDAGVGVLGGTIAPAVVRESVLAALAEARAAWTEERFDLLVIDEINNALHRGLLSCKELIDLLAERPPAMEVVLTGRNAPQELLDSADLVTYMDCLRHPLQKGIAAREGIEF